MKLEKIKKLALDAIYPQFCLNCNKEGSVICADCFSLIEISEYTFCPFCSTPQRVFKKGTCDKHQNKSLDGLFSATPYSEALVKKLIYNFKYSLFLKTLSPYLAYLIIAHFISSQNQQILNSGENSLFIPIPIHKNKKRKRGFNQSELIAKELSLVSNIPLNANVLIKTKKTQSQTKLTKEERAQNVKNSFKITNPEIINKKIIFLVDDVFTTGSTMFEAARVLKKAGALQVWGVTVAREA
jgi:ComF family protein